MDRAARQPPLPISTGSFQSIRAKGLFYLDKTRQIASLLEPENHYVFLARPRRFGKSLLVSTLEALFKGERSLFAGTWIDGSDWSWEPHAVISLEMTERRAGGASALEQSLHNRMAKAYRMHGEELPPGDWSAPELLEDLIERLAARRPVAVLIDEYDAPILQNLERPDALPGIRDVLRRFYGALKAQDARLNFAFLTGITRFARTNIFSGLNNLRDISLSARFSDLVGFTETELDRYLTPYVQAMARTRHCSVTDVRQAMRTWYDGYVFAPGGARVYNPYSTLYCLAEKAFDYYWPLTGIPIYLTRMIAQRKVDLRQLAGQKAPALSQAFFHWNEPDLLAVMYQAGYLTLTPAPGGPGYVLDYPNREVGQSFILTLLGEFTPPSATATQTAGILYAALEADDYDRFFATFNELAQLIPYEIFAGDHKHYQLLLHSIFVLLHLKTDSERSSYRGRMDTVVELSDRVAIFEYKLDADPAAALAQLEAKGYHHEFLVRGQAVVGVGVRFDAEQRQAVAWQVRRYGQA